ncbi:hypothetical protein ACHAXR_010739 [Thalassiosira sp. AJA248-18]
MSGSILRTADAMKILCLQTIAPPSSRQLQLSRSRTALQAGNNRWWDGDGSENMTSNSERNGQNRRQSSYDQQYEQYATGGEQKQPSFITREIEEDVMASARATIDSNTVSRAISSLIDNKSGTFASESGERGGPARANKKMQNEFEKKGGNSLRDLALSTTDNNGGMKSSSYKNDQSISDNSNSWDTNQIAIASGATTLLLSPLVIPIIHSILPPIIPFPSSISFTGAALLGTLSYIVALGDPTDQSMGDGVEVGGAVSRIVGRTALQSVETSAPRIKAAARAMVDYDSTTATLEELQRVQLQLSQTVLGLETENDALRKEVALWQAVEDVSSMYKLEELKEMARYEGIKGYSSDGKNALLRRLVKEGVLKLDLSPYY